MYTVKSQAYFNRIHDITVPSFLEGFNFHISSFLCFTVKALICLLLILEYSFYTICNIF